MSDAVFKDDYDDMEIPASQVTRANPGVPTEEIFGKRSISGLDQMTAVSRETADLLKNKMDTDEALRARNSGRYEEDRGRALKSWDAMGVEADKIQPWDQDKAREQFKTNPIESFGSIGSVFAMLASAFTHAPMTNALNASAAAMHAIKDGNEAEYEKAFRAFKENNELVIKRHAMMSTQYNAAATLMDKDMAAGRDALAQNAAKFGDQRLLTLLQNGFDKEALDYVHSVGRLEKDHAEVSATLDKTSFQRDALNKALKNNEQIPDPRMRELANQQDFNRIMFGKELSPQQKLAEIIMAQNPGASHEKLTELFNNAHILPRYGVSGTTLEADLETFKKAARAEHPDWTEDRVIEEARQRLKRANSVAGSKPAEERRKEIMADVTREHPEMTPGQKDLEVERRLKQAGNVVTANVRLKEQEKIDKLGFAIETMDKIHKPIATKLGPVGAPAYATRLLERVGNLFPGGTKSTEYVQLQRDINLLKAWAPANLLGRDSKPLSAEHGQMNSIIAGLSLGDTVYNTLRAHKDLRALYVKMQQSAVKRLEGEWKPPGSESEEPTGPRRSGNFKPAPWLDAPLVK